MGTIAGSASFRPLSGSTQGLESHIQSLEGQKFKPLSKAQIGELNTKLQTLSREISLLTYSGYKLTESESETIRSLSDRVSIMVKSEKTPIIQRQLLKINPERKETVALAEKLKEGLQSNISSASEKTSKPFTQAIWVGVLVREGRGKEALEVLDSISDPKVKTKTYVELAKEGNLDLVMTDATRMNEEDLSSFIGALNEESESDMSKAVLKFLPEHLCRVMGPDSGMKAASLIQDPKIKSEAYAQLSRAGGMHQIVEHAKGLPVDEGIEFLGRLKESFSEDKSGDKTLFNEFEKAVDAALEGLQTSSTIKDFGKGEASLTEVSGFFPEKKASNEPEVKVLSSSLSQELTDVDEWEKVADETGSITSEDSSQMEISAMSSPGIEETSSPSDRVKADFIKQINQYSVRDFKDSVAVQQELLEYLDSKGVEALNEGCPEVSSTKAREAFIKFLLDQNVSKAPAINKSAIPLNAILGEKGAKLYKAALAEEHNSKEFRAAVYLAASSKRGTEKVDPKVIFVVGPSAAGKSSGLEAVIKEVYPESGKENKSGQNKLTAIDGAIERELSHTSHLLLTFANKQGYQGVVGLHVGEGDKEVKSVKKCVLAAVQKNKSQDISIIMPETFSGYGIGGQMGVEGVAKRRLKAGKLGELINFAKETKRGAVLIGIAGENPKDFRNAVSVMGNKRAWAQMGSETPEISPEAKLSCESKEYGASGFRFGVAGSEAATKAFKEEIQKYPGLDARQFTITNDLIAYKKDIYSEDGWKKIEDTNDAKTNSDSAVLISRPLMEVWQDLSKLDPKHESHKEALEGFRDKGDLAGFASYCRKSGMSGVNMKEEVIIREDSK